MNALAWVFAVTDRVGRLTTARVTVNAANLITVTTPDGSSFGLDTGEQYVQFSAALRQARELALLNQDREQRPIRHRRGRRG